MARRKPRYTFIGGVEGYAVVVAPGGIEIRSYEKINQPGARLNVNDATMFQTFLSSAIKTRKLQVRQRRRAKRA